MQQDQEFVEESGGGVRLEKRRLTAPEAARLHEELKSTANILGYTPTELLKFGEVHVALGGPDEDAPLAGACLCKDLLWGWTDIAVLYVLPEFRGRGISTRLFAAALDHARSRKRHVYALSRSPEVIHLMERFGMRTTRQVWIAPLPVHLEMNRHMMSLYRLREAGRKSKMRLADGYEFVGGTLRQEKG